MSFDEPLWWPFAFEETLERQFSDFRFNVLTDEIILDTALARQVADDLVTVMASNISEVVARDGLPHLAHAVVGWGDAQFEGTSLCDRIADFASSGAGQPFIPQCDPEGDFHPWQSFAYAAMAGCSGGRKLGAFDFSLRDLIQNSRVLQTSENRELGHLLYALATYDPDISGRPFNMDGVNVPVRELAERAVEAHIYGTFDVCRKFHLTEGLCAAVSCIPEFSSWRPHAEGFLDGQMTVLELFALVMGQVRAVENGGGDREAVRAWRHKLRIGPNLENHLFYAGHLVELAGLARMHGFELRQTQKNAANFVLNEINRTICRWQRHMTFRDCFLGLSHFRRAATLWMAHENGSFRNTLSQQDVLRSYAADFEKFAPDLKTPEADPVPVGSIYELARTEQAPRPIFSQVLEAYVDTEPPTGLLPRGTFDHFRRIGPPHWPRSVHYEFLDHETAVGIEIHLEKDEVSALKPTLEAAFELVRSQFSGAHVILDEKWYNHCGRLVVFCPDEIGAVEIAKSARRLIDMTFDMLDRNVAALGAVSSGDRIEKSLT